MARFMLLDHGLTTLGGHHYQYDVPVLEVAEQLGYEVVLAFSKRFKDAAQLPARWQAHAIYELPRARLYSSLKLLQRRIRQHQRRQSVPRTWRRLLDWPADLSDAFFCGRLEREHAERAGNFACQTGELLRGFPLQPGDQVFLSDATPIDVQGLVKLFESRSVAQTADWHLLFHFPLFPGRTPPGGVHSPPVRQLRSIFRQAQRWLTRHRLHFYTTSDALTDQFNRLEIGRFQTLELPAGPCFRPATAAGNSSRPLQVASLGAIRREKGKYLWAQLVDDLWADCLENGDLQIVLQAKSLRKLPAALRKRWTRMLAHQRRDRPLPLRLAPYPLDTARYAQLIVDSDIGLMLYDQDNYYYRASGVMVELLNAGVPVVVMAGTWMAEQISEVIFAYHQQILDSTPIIETVTAAQVEWRHCGDPNGPGQATSRSDRALQVVPRESDACLTLGGAGAALTGRLAAVTGASHLMIQFEWPAPILRGECADLRVRQKDGSGVLLEETRDIVGSPQQRGASSVMIRLREGARQIEIVWCNAFGQTALTVDQVRFHFLASVANLSSGYVGLIAADFAQIPRLLKEMAEHHAYYRRTARDFSVRWTPRHNHAHVVAALLANSSLGKTAVSNRPWASAG